MAKPSISAEQFVKIWQNSDSVEEVMEKTGMKKATITARAHAYRKKGVPLKHYKPSGPVDWERLANLAEKLSDHGDDNE